MNVENVLSDLIRIDTVNPPGNEMAICRYLKSLFDDAGIPNEIQETAEGRGNFFACLGEGQKRLLYASHTDTVSVSPGWSFGPFSGELRDGFVHGRGAQDCKGLVAAEANAMLELAKSSSLKGRLIFAATADEERGGALGMRLLAEQHPDRVRADFAINEGADPPVKIGNTTYDFISVGEKGPGRLTVRTKGYAGHSSVPVLENNAVVKMGKAITNLAGYKARVVLIPDVKKLLQVFAGIAGFHEEITEANVDRAIQSLGSRGLQAQFTAETRMTVSPNIVQGGARVNITPDACHLDCDIRVMPGQDAEYIKKELTPLLGDAEIDVAQTQAASFSPVDSRHYSLIYNTAKDCLPDLTPLASICPATTDSRFLRAIGVPTYGIGMMARNLDPLMKASVHGKDEKIDIESLRLRTDFLVSLARNYLGA